MGVEILVHKEYLNLILYTYSQMEVRMDGRTDRNTLMQDFISGEYTGKHFSLNFKILR